jgi:hypothetical protein
MLRVKLRHRDMETPSVLALLDTGADRCMFDHQLALLAGVNVYEAGASSSATGIGGLEKIAVFPIHVAFPNLDDASWEIHAQFKALPDGIDAILGHAGFLGRMTATFVEGKEFELSDIRR